MPPTRNIFSSCTLTEGFGTLGVGGRALVAVARVSLVPRLTERPGDSGCGAAEHERAMRAGRSERERVVRVG
jgi:hypothetical protein